MGRQTLIGTFWVALSLLGSLNWAHAASPVWVIHGDHNTVYLAGSVHLLKANDSALPAAFERAYSGYHVWVSDQGWWYATRRRPRVHGQAATVHARSEERRVGKEC